VFLGNLHLYLDLSFFIT